MVSENSQPIRFVKKKRVDQLDHGVLDGDSVGESSKYFLAPHNQCWLYSWNKRSKYLSKIIKSVFFCAAPHTWDICLHQRGFKIFPTLNMKAGVIYVDECYTFWIVLWNCCGNEWKAIEIKFAMFLFLSDFLKHRERFFAQPLGQNEKTTINERFQSSFLSLLLYNLV